jgi:hypothetical protein
LSTAAATFVGERHGISRCLAANLHAESDQERLSESVLTFGCEGFERLPSRNLRFHRNSLHTDVTHRNVESF